MSQVKNTEVKEVQSRNARASIRAVPGIVIEVRRESPAKQAVPIDAMVEGKLTVVKRVQFSNALTPSST